MILLPKPCIKRYPSQLLLPLEYRVICLTCLRMEVSKLMNIGVGLKTQIYVL